jgi:hypothetical protein
MSFEQASFSLHDKIAISLGRGVCFIESRLSRGKIGKADLNVVREIAHRYPGRPFAIDHRDRFLAMISDEGQRKGSFTLAVILDDAAETVDDLVWLSALMEEFSFLRVVLLINTAQISVNFSSHFLEEVLSFPALGRFAGWLGTRLRVERIYCPFISFQTNYLPPNALAAIDAADAVYIKGANFFETCQLYEKHTFHAFVVHGPISRAYSGLDDFQAVFAHVPPGTSGYVHHRDRRSITTLRQICSSHESSPESLIKC